MVVRKVGMLIVCLLIGGAISVSLGIDINFDMHNYHIYNGYAFITGRVFNDMPGNIFQNYLNPLLDVLNYLLVYNLNEYPTIYAFIQGLWYGILIFIVYHIANLYLKQDIKLRLLVLITAVGIGVTGFAVYTQIGTMFNEVQVGVIFLIGFYFISKYIFFSDAYRPSMFFLGGLFMGVAMGIKLTVGVYCLGVGLTLIILAWKIKKPVVTIFFVGLGGICGFLIINGWWMYLLYSHFGNPVFPYYNSIFKSPYYLLMDHHDMRFFPRSVFDAVFFPFQWITYSTKYASEIPFRDPRWASLYILVLGSLITFILSKTKRFGQWFKMRLGVPDLFLIVYLIISFILWEKTFAILRYSVSMEALTGIAYVIMVFYIFQWIEKRKIFVICFSILTIVLCYVFSTYANWGRQALSKNIMNISAVNIPDDNMIVMHGATNLYIIPYLQTNAVVMAYAYADAGKYSTKARKMINEFKGDKVVIGSEIVPGGSFVEHSKDMYCKIIGNLYRVPMCVPTNKLDKYFNMEFVSPADVMTSYDLKLAFRGWNISETSHRWSYNETAEIIFYVKDPDKFIGEIVPEFWTNGEQSMKIYLNDIAIENFSRKSFEGKLDIKFDRTILKSGANILRFELPDASSSDTAAPKLAIALKTIEFK